MRNALVVALDSSGTLVLFFPRCLSSTNYLLIAECLGSEARFTNYTEDCFVGTVCFSEQSATGGISMIYIV